MVTKSQNLQKNNLITSPNFNTNTSPFPLTVEIKSQLPFFTISYTSILTQSTTTTPPLKLSHLQLLLLIANANTTTITADHIIRNINIIAP